MDTSGYSSPRRNQPNGYPQQYSRPSTSGQGASVPPPDSLRLGQNTVNRAEKFEDEKVRIMTSCFSKRDDKGALYQSYITHIRVEEDGMWPSDPPPASADPAYKKARVIIVAVKNTGRVYMHKARENEDNTFQIGKTWPLEELQCIESFSPEVDRGQEDVQRALLGGPAGLVITMAKPYYWRAQTPKEKDFFIGSLCKIFRKYTGGTDPQLVGFSQRELVEILGVGQLQPPASRPEAPRTSPLPGQERPIPRPRRPSDMSADSSIRSPSAASSGQRPPSPLRHRNISQGGDRHQPPTMQPPPPGRTTTPQLRQRTSQDASLRSRASHDQVRNGRLQAPGSGMTSRASPQPSSTNSVMPSPALRPEIPDGPLAQSRYGSDQQPSGTSENLMASTTQTWRPQAPPSRPLHGHMANDSIASSNYLQSPGTPGQNNSQQLLPERRRPPLDESVYSPPSIDNARHDASAVPKPLWSKPSKADELRQRPAPSESPSQLDAKIPGAFGAPSPAPTPPPAETSNQPTSKKSFLSTGLPNGQQSQPSSRPTTPHAASIAKPASSGAGEASNGSATSPQENRPGLGPMVSKKLMSPTTGKNWGKAMKAATAANAFKPRAGGAGERLLASKAKISNEPDGVTGVVPAPSAVRGVSGDSTGPTSKVSSSGRPSMETGDRPYVPRTTAASAPSGDPLMENDASIDPWTYNQGRGDAGSLHSRQASQAQDSRPLPPPSRYNESLAALDIDAATFDGRGRDYEATLAEFGWSSEILQARTLETMEVDLRKEVGRLEAGSWLGHTGQGDERVVHFEAALDRAIAECDEMEGLLTLYGVELSVSLATPLFAHENCGCKH